VPAVNVTDPVHTEIEALPIPALPLTVKEEATEVPLTVGVPPGAEINCPLLAGKVIINWAP